MRRLAESFLTALEQQRINEAVQRAERQTSGEIVPMVVSASHHYPLAAASGGVVLALPLALMLTSLLGSTLWLGSQNMWLFLLFSTILYLPARAFVAHSIVLKRFFLRADQVAEEVEEAAITSFYREKLYRTRDQNGILIFISVLERRVYILGDRGIDAKINNNSWQEIVNGLTAGIRRGKQGEALLAAVNQVGEILKHHFPIQEGDRNELRNLIIRS
jgi:putative membrane protein